MVRRPDLRWIALASVFSASSLIFGCASEENDPTRLDTSNDPGGTFEPVASELVLRAPAADAVELPAPGDWTDHGVIFSAGRAKQWDRYLWGGFAATVVKRNGQTLLYYQGARGYDEIEGTVTYRAIGVAVSANGLDFTKYQGNPVLTWSPTGGIEEGAVSSGAFLGDDGTVNVHYGANTATASGLVSANGRLADSVDGFEFVDRGVVLDHTSSRFWGFGDELFPVMAFREGASWYVYYIPNGTSQSGNLGVAWGPDNAEMAQSAQVVAGGTSVAAWGPAGWARLNSSLYALFVASRGDAHQTGWHTDAYLVDPASPTTLTGPVQIYDFDNMVSGTVLLDQAAATWYMYYRNADASAYGVRTATFDQVEPQPSPTRHSPVPTVVPPR